MPFSYGISCPQQLKDWSTKNTKKLPALALSLCSLCSERRERFVVGNSKKSKSLALIRKAFQFLPINALT